MKIIGVSGTNGSGKDSFGQILADYHNWLFVSVTDILRDELKKRGLPIERENMRLVGNEWRREYGHGVLINKAVEQFEPKSNQYKGLVISSLRNAGEVDKIHELGGQVVWIDAEPKLRYERITERMRGDEDKKTLEQFLAEEQAEMERSGDEATLSLAEVKAKADIKIDNNTKTLDEFRQHIERALKL